MRTVLLLSLVAGALALQPLMPREEVASNEIQRQMAADSLLSDIMNQCFQSLNLESMTCMRVRVLMYMNQLLGSNQGRQPHYQPHMAERKDNGPLPDAVPRDEDTADKLDEMIAGRVVRYARSHVFQMQLPETVFQSARVTFSPSTFDLDYTFPAEPAGTSRAMSEARGILKKKLLLPILLLLKLKMKALMPILVLISSIKAVKALVISKIALLVVGAFVFLQLCKKLGGGAMMMPGMMMPSMPEMTPAPPSAAYGAAPMPYSAPAAPQNSYGPAESSWEPSPAASNSYSRVYDAHQMAYKAYYNPQPDATVQPAPSAAPAGSQQ